MVQQAEAGSREKRVRRRAYWPAIVVIAFVAAGYKLIGAMTTPVLAVEGEAAAAVPPNAGGAAEPAAKPAAKTAEHKGETTADGTKKFGDWALVCPKEDDKEAGKSAKDAAKDAGKDAAKDDAKKAAKDAANECRLVQTALLTVPNKEGGEPHTQRVMLTAVGYIGDEKQPVLSVIVPLGVLLQPGLVLEAEGYDQLKLPLQRCDANGCLALLPMKEQLVEAFRKGKEAQITFFNIAGKGNKVRISLTGFSSALDNLGKQRKS